MMAIQCSLPSARPTTLPARCVVGKTENAVGARPKAKKMSPPIQQTSDSSIKNRRKDMTEDYRLVPSPELRVPSTEKNQQQGSHNCDGVGTGEPTVNPFI